MIHCKRDVKFLSIKLFIVVLILVANMISCDKRSVSIHDEIESCQFSNINMDSLIFERDKANDSLLFEQVKNCQDMPNTVRLKLDLLTHLKRFREGLKYLNTLNHNNFNNNYDSLIYRTFFESKFTENQEVKIKMFKVVTEELEKYLVNSPLDTLAIGNYCLYSLKFRSPEYVFEKIDSMAFVNNYDPTYGFVMSLYFPDQYRYHQKRILQ